MIPVITTERLVLRPFAPDDLPALAVLHAEESFWWYPLRRGMSQEETKDFLSRVIGRYDSDGIGLEAAGPMASHSKNRARATALQLHLGGTGHFRHKTSPTAMS